MAHVAPFHTDSREYPPTHRNVFHNHSLCEHGKAIKPEHRVPGTGGLERCDRCEALADEAHGSPILRIVSAPFRVVGKLVSRLVHPGD